MGNPASNKEVYNNGEKLMGNPSGSKVRVVGKLNRINKNNLDKLNILKTKECLTQANKEESRNFGAKSIGFEPPVRVELLNTLDEKQVCLVEEGPEIVDQVKTVTIVKTDQVIKKD